MDFLASIEPLVLTDDRRSIATEARVRIVRASASAGYVVLQAATYEVSVTPAGAKTPVAIFATLPLENGDVFNVIARDAPGGGAPLGLLVEYETG